MKNNWKYNPGNKNQASLYSFGDYVISCWNAGHENAYYCLRYGPPGQHINLGDYGTLDKAKEIAESHANNIDKILVKI